MSYGHWGKGLRVNLTTGTITVETLDEAYLRRYVGGWGFIAYTLLKELEAGIDPLGPDNKLIYATGPVTGQPMAGGGRHMIGGKSPLTGGFSGSESGGYFGAELKRAGWDQIIFEGVSPKPVYLWINDDQIELRSAEALWGQETLDVEVAIRAELGDKRIRVSQCGIAGENLVLVSNVIHDATRAAGRTGLGAVMGSKKLKAVAVRGTQRPPVADEATLGEIAKWFRDNYKETGSAVFATVGTNRMVRVNQGVGGLPTRNFQQGTFDQFEKLAVETMQATMVAGRESCYGCPVRCKWELEVKDGPYPLRREYGGPEYETVGALGTVCGMDDLNQVAYAGLLCNAYGLDSIGTGVTIGWAMECYEKGIITKEDTGGLDLRFGNGEAMIEMVKQIAHRRGLGALLADGSKKASQKVGKGSEALTIQIKGQEVAMHDPRTKYGHGLGIAVSPTGADHMHSVHDSGYGTEQGINDLKPLGVLAPLPWDDLSVAKAQMVRRAMMWRITFNLDGICMFHAYTTEQITNIINACTGWNTSVMELWTAGERAYDMARAFNAREGFGPDDDLLPPRFYEALQDGPTAGKVYSRETFIAARDAFYAMMGWDPTTAAPTRAKLEDLDIAWVADLLDK
jgi:aldehyde:ferredoxin oxidoreductase